MTLLLDRTKQERVSLIALGGGDVWMGFDRKAFAKNLRVKRAEMNISQGELADRSGISLATISQYETENFIPGIDRVVQLAESLGCSPNDLIGWGN